MTLRFSLHQQSAGSTFRGVIFVQTKEVWKKVKNTHSDSDRRLNEDLEREYMSTF